MVNDELVEWSVGAGGGRGYHMSLCLWQFIQTASSVGALMMEGIRDAGFTSGDTVAHAVGNSRSTVGRADAG